MLLQRHLFRIEASYRHNDSELFRSTCILGQAPVECPVKRVIRGHMSEVALGDHVRFPTGLVDDAGRERGRRGGAGESIEGRSNVSGGIDECSRRFLPSFHPRERPG